MLSRAWPGLAAAAFFAAALPAHAAAPGVSAKEVLVGTHVDLSGPLSPMGTAVRNGLLMAFDDINARGGVGGRRLKLIAADNGYDAKKAIVATERLLKQDRVFAVLCPSGTPPVAATMPAVLNAGILHLFPFTSPDETYVPSQPLEFAADIPVSRQIAVGLERLLGARAEPRVGVLYREDAFGKSVLKGATALLKRHRMRVAAALAFKPDSRSFARQAAQLRKAGANIVVLGATSTEVLSIARAFRRGGPALLCPSACYQPEVATLGGTTVDGLYSVTVAPWPYPNDRDVRVRNWVRRYETRFHAVASAQAMRAYINAFLFAEALNRAGNNPTQTSFARALEAMPGWRDADLPSLPVDFTARDHLGLHDGFLVQIRNGRWERLPPAPVSRPLRRSLR